MSEWTLTEILDRVRGAEVSDIFLTAGRPPVLAMAGRLEPLDGAVLDDRATGRLVREMLEKEQIARLERERELDFSLTFSDGARFRGNAFWQKGSLAAVLRPIPSDIPDLESLGLPPGVIELTSLRQGLVLVTGPTGHGKSTTLAAMVDRINRTRACHIVTVEDPIEFVHHHRLAVVEQREVGVDTLSFAAALRHVLRQSPDVLLVGELRDLETISCALTAAETGHLVLATLHTNDAPQTIDRLIDVFPEGQQAQVRTQLSMALRAIVSQLLLPAADGMGRVLACEVLRVTPAAANLIREHKGQQLLGVMETSGKQGMRSMDQAVRQLFQDMRITREAAERAMKHPQTLHG